MECPEDALFLQSDLAMQQVATAYLGYRHDKGLDFLGKSDGKFIMGAAKFLSDFGGHQTAQFNDAISTMTSSLKNNGKEVKKSQSWMEYFIFLAIAGCTASCCITFCIILSGRCLS